MKMAKNSTKRALVTSIMAMVLCVAMLAGTTFAWFTDSVTSGNNKIVSGSLKVDLEVLTDEGWKSVKESNEAIFTYDNWEPGYTEMKFLKVVNEGTLALKWKAMLVTGGEIGKLAEVIDVYVYDFGATEPTVPTDRNLEGWTKVGTLDQFIASIESTTTGEILPNEEKNAFEALGIAFKMQENAGNEYQNLTLGAFDISIVATQLASEKDSFNDQYDSAAAQSAIVNGVSYETLQAAIDAANEGDTVYATGMHTPITVGKAITLNLSNVKIDATAASFAARTAAPVNAITVTEDATIVLGGISNFIGAETGSGIYAEGAALTLKGDGTVIAKGNAGLENWSDLKNATGGHGIGADKDAALVIDGLKIIAEGNGKAGFGIGGATTSITVNNATVQYVKGGFVQPNLVYDTSYGKNEPEGGAAIGSLTAGAVINMTNTVVTRADGGSKAAGIGARYWTGLTVNITDCEITAFGGNASAGIGGSRVDKKLTAAQQKVTVNIVRSTINATGGEFAAGIGSGYNTHCTYFEEPICAIYIDKDSKITAQGGKYGAGIGTGYHVAALEGNIECEVNATAGESREKYTVAQEIGFGVVDYTREAQGDFFITYQGTKIEIPGEQAANADKLVEILESGNDVALSSDVKIDPAGMSNAYGKTGINVKNGQTVDGNGHTLDIKGAGGTWDSGINTTGGLIKNITITGSFRGVFINHNSEHSEKVVLENVIIDGTTYTISCDQGSNQGLEATNSTFKGWTSYAATLGNAKFTECYFGAGNGYSFMRPYAPTEFVNCEFEAGFKMDPRAAVTFENCTIGGVALTSENLSTLVTSNIANASVK